MIWNVSKNTNVNLENIDVCREVDARLFLVNLTSFEWDVFHDVLYQSSRFTIDRLSEYMHAHREDVALALKTISASGLLRVEGEYVTVDKEQRKFYEFQTEKFESDFTPNINYVIQLLNKVPFEVLLNWYAIPQTTNHIVSSIIENYLETPKKFQQHMKAFLAAEIGAYTGIIEKLYQSPDLKLSAEEVRQEFRLSQKEFEHIVLKFEYNFLCFLTYEKQQGQWKEFLRPLSEWVGFLSHQKPNWHELSTSASATENFTLLQKINGTLVDLREGGECRNTTLKEWLVNLGFLASDQEKNALSAMGSHWLEKPLDKQARLFHRKLLLTEELGLMSDSFSYRDFRALESSFLELLPSQSWVKLDEYLEHLTIPIGNEPGVRLQKFKGTWRYIKPNYFSETIAWVKKAINEFYAAIGLIETIFYENRLYLRLTPLGEKIFHRHSL